MARKTTQKTTRKKNATTAKRFQFQLGWSGLLGVSVVTFCLFLWMFMLGVWAGQTILLPSAGADRARVAVSELKVKPHQQSEALPAIRPESKKTPVSK